MIHVVGVAQYRSFRLTLPCIDVRLLLILLQLQVIDAMTMTAAQSVVMQTQQDLALHSWYRLHGVIGTLPLPESKEGCDSSEAAVPSNIRGGVRLVTTNQSIAGRGVFWTSGPKPQAYGLHRGDVLALIPGKLALSPTNLQGSLPFFRNLDTVVDDNDERYSWPCILAAYCYLAWKQGTDVRDYDTTRSTVKWHDWIGSWVAGGDLGGMPRPAHKYADDDKEEIALLTKTLSTSKVEEVVQKQYTAFENDWDRAREFLSNGAVNEKISNEKIKDEFGLLYRLCLSRAANLGPQWANEMGVIPLHDMINHPPPNKEANVELFCLGDIRSAIGNDGLKSLLSPLMHQLQVEKNILKVPHEKFESPKLLDNDFALVARTNINPGDELFLSYRRDTENLNDEKRIWLWLQYGFPL
jgi:hypothetical protein